MEMVLGMYGTPSRIGGEVCSVGAPVKCEALWSFPSCRPTRRAARPDRPKRGPKGALELKRAEGSSVPRCFPLLAALGLLRSGCCCAL
jgi:hypothetical protein